jgi:hypothetical protein
MYTDLTNKLNTGIKSRFTGFDAVNSIGASAAEEAKLSWVGSALKNLVRAFDRLGTYPAVDDSVFGFQAYLAGDLSPAPMAREARRLARASYVVTPETIAKAKAYRHYDYFDLLADHGYFHTAVALDVAKRMRSRQHKRHDRNAA